MAAVVEEELPEGCPVPRGHGCAAGVLGLVFAGAESPFDGDAEGFGDFFVEIGFVAGFGGGFEAEAEDGERRGTVEEAGVGAERKGPVGLGLPVFAAVSDGTAADSGAEGEEVFDGDGGFFAVFPAGEIGADAGIEGEGFFVVGDESEDAVEGLGATEEHLRLVGIDSAIVMRDEGFAVLDDDDAEAAAGIGVAGGGGEIGLGGESEED